MKLDSLKSRIGHQSVHDTDKNVSLNALKIVSHDIKNMIKKSKANTKNEHDNLVQPLEGSNSEICEQNDHDMHSDKHDQKDDIDGDLILGPYKHQMT